MAKEAFDQVLWDEMREAMSPPLPSEPATSPSFAAAPATQYDYYPPGDANTAAPSPVNRPNVSSLPPSARAYLEKYEKIAERVKSTSVNTAKPNIPAKRSHTHSKHAPPSMPAVTGNTSSSLPPSALAYLKKYEIIGKRVSADSNARQRAPMQAKAPTTSAPLPSSALAYLKKYEQIAKSVAASRQVHAKPTQVLAPAIKANAGNLPPEAIAYLQKYEAISRKVGASSGENNPASSATKRKTPASYSSSLNPSETPASYTSSLNPSETPASYTSSLNPSETPSSYTSSLHPSARAYLQKYQAVGRQVSASRVQKDSGFSPSKRSRQAPPLSIPKDASLPPSALAYLEKYEKIARSVSASQGTS